MKYRKKSSLIDATQWLRNGDHPEDESEPMSSGSLSEGKVVQHYRSLDAMDQLDALNALGEASGNQYCPHCGNRMRRHGVLDGANGEEYVCPGDYVVTDRSGVYYRLSRGEFESQYEPYVRPPRYPDIPISDLEERKQSRRAQAEE